MATAYALILDNGNNTYSMVFTKSDVTIVPGNTYNGTSYGALPVAAVYTGFETTVYFKAADVPWRSSYATKITSVAIEDEIAPLSTAMWFNNFANCTSINMALLDTKNVTSMTGMFYKASALTNLDVSKWDTSAVTDMYGIFGYCTSLTNLDVSNWDTSNVTTLDTAFANCTSLASLDVSNWDTSNVTTMKQMFYGCSSLSNLDVSKWDTSSVTNLQTTFLGCSKLTSLNISNWDTSAVTNMYGTFMQCTSLTSLDISNWNTSNVTTMSKMFAQANYAEPHAPITTLDVSKWDTSSCTDMGWMFYGMADLKSIDVSKWDVSKVEIFHHTFAWCSKLVVQGVENWNTSSAIAMNALFHENKNVTLDLSGWDVSKVRTFAQMFERNTELVEIKGLEKWNTSSARSFCQMFYGCQKLKKLDLSSFDTRKASTSYTDEWNSEVGGMSEMLGVRHVGADASTEKWGWMMRLEKITFGENFVSKGDGSSAPARVTAPDPTYIDGADGYWYDAEGNPYTPAEIPDGTGTYYASIRAIDTVFSIKKGTLMTMANAVREKIGSSEKMTPHEMIDEIQGIAVGDASYDEGFADGKQAEYDAFWDAFQNYGNPKNYGYVFAYDAFTDETYNPKYPINCTYAVAMSGQYVFTYSKITNTKVPVICGANRAMSSAFANSKIETIPKFVVLETNTFGNTFQKCEALKNITIEGVVANNISFADSSLLSRESIVSVIDHLSDTASGKTVTLSKTAVDKACAEAELSDLINSTNSAWWAWLIGTKPNWTISLV